MTGPPADPVDVVLPLMSFHEHDRRRAAELCVEALRRAGLLASGGSGEAPASVMLWVCDNCGDLAECEPGDECEVCCEGTIQRVEYAPVRASSGEEVELRRCPKCKRLTTAFECCYVKGPPLIPQLDDSTMTVPVRGVFIEGGSGEEHG